MLFFYKLKVMNKISQDNSSCLQFNKLQPSGRVLHISELIDRLSLCIPYLLGNPRLISAILKKCILSAKYQNLSPNSDQANQISTSLMKIQLDKHQGVTENNKMLFRRIQNIIIQSLNKKMNKQIQSATKATKTIYKPAKSQSHAGVTENEQKINEWLRLMREDKLIAAGSQCLGCISVLYNDHLPDFKNSTQSNLIENLNLFQNQQYYTENICALLNTNGGYLFITQQSNVLSPNKLMGLTLSLSDKDKYKAFLERCIKYIEPRVERDCYHVDFIPVFESPLASDSSAAGWIVRLTIKPKLKSLYYISYKLLKSEKNCEVQFFKLDKDGNVVLMQFQEVYEKIHSSFKIKGQNYLCKHQGVSCYEPLQVTKICHQPPQTNSIKAKGQGNFGQNANKFKHTILIIKQKECKDDEKRMQQIQKELIGKKILCQVEKIELKDAKTKQWIICYDCPSESVEQVIKQHNRNGELSFARAKRCVKVSDQQFLAEKKENAILDKIKMKLNLEGKQSKLDYKLFNTPELTLNRSSKMPVYFKFKNLRHAILCYSLIYATNRRLEFVQIKH